MKKPIIVALFFCLCLFAGLEYFYGRYNNGIGKLYDRDFKNLSREDQIKKCGECHKMEFDNERDGPHSIAFRTLEAHKKFVNGPTYDCRPYTEAVNAKFDNTCVNCHAPSNMYETVFKTNEAPDSFISKILLSKRHIDLVSREDKNAMKTGVDCMSCHFDGTGVLSRNVKYKQPSQAVCNPKYSAIFNNVNVTCYPCHSDVVTSFDQAVQNNKSLAMSCDNCHMEYGRKNKITHYYYWAQGSSRTDNRVLDLMLNDISYLPGQGASGPSIKWANRSMPHVLESIPEMVLTFEVLNGDSAVLGSEIVRFNSKAESDSIMHQNHADEINPYAGGTVGVYPPALGERSVYPIKVIRSASARMLKIQVTRKEQFWFPDSLGVIVYTKIKPI